MLAMNLATQVRSISYLKANAADVLRQLNEAGEPLLITQNGESCAVLQDVASYCATQETLALLKILALGARQVQAGDVQPVREVVARLRALPSARMQ
jgi:prevent-host-death family protein